jgi:hypothetical protein
MRRQLKRSDRILICFYKLKDNLTAAERRTLRVTILSAEKGNGTGYCRPQSDDAALLEGHS